MSTNPSIITVTEEGLRALREELEYLRNEKRKEVVESIRVALSFGDLSENSEYDEAKNEQAKVEGRITELEEMLKHVHVIDDSQVSGDTVNVGSHVVVRDEATGEEEEYDIVGSTEADPLSDKISDQSPIGMSLIGARKGDVVSFESPMGLIRMKVEAVSKP